MRVLKSDLLADRFANILRSLQNVFLFSELECRIHKLELEIVDVPRSCAKEPKQS